MKQRNPRRKRRRLATSAGLTPAEKREMRDLSQTILRMSRELWDAVDLCDTAVRDTASYGIAYLLHVAFDCQAIELGLDDVAFHAFIANSTAEWFRQRGCAEWFCSGAARLFTTTRPRTLTQSMPHRYVKTNTKKRKRKPKKPKVGGGENAGRP